MKSAKLETQIGAENEGQGKPPAEAQILKPATGENKAAERAKKADLRKAAQISAELKGENLLSGKWETDKKDPSLPDNPTREQLEAAGYKEHSVRIPFRQKSFISIGGARMKPNRERIVREANEELRKIAKEHQFIFRAKKEDETGEIRSVFVKSPSQKLKNK